MSRGWGRGSTRAHRRVREEILRINRIEHDGMCRLAIPDVCTGLADCVHHTRGKTVTGNNPHYMIAACAACNLRTGDPTRTPDPPGRSATQW